MHNGVAILGTGTNVGKTTVVAGLAKAMARFGAAVSVIKPIQTGCVLDEGGNVIAPDIEIVREACPNVASDAFFLFQEPCSPHLAASIEDRDLCAFDILSCFEKRKKDFSFDITLVEFAGGLMVPLNNKETQLDVLKALCIPILLVIPNRLGAINHALLTLSALREREVDILGVIFSSPQGSIDTSLERKIKRDNKQVITLMGNIACKGDLPFLETLSSQKREERAKAWETIAALLSSTAESLLPPVAL